MLLCLVPTWDSFPVWLYCCTKYDCAVTIKSYLRKCWVQDHDRCGSTSSHKKLFPQQRKYYALKTWCKWTNEWKHGTETLNIPEQVPCSASATSLPGKDRDTLVTQNTLTLSLAQLTKSLLLLQQDLCFQHNNHKTCGLCSLAGESLWATPVDKESKSF